MSDPQTTLHYAPNANLVGDTYARPRPRSGMERGADGFNLADVSSVGAANELPNGVKRWFGLATPGAIRLASNRWWLHSLETRRSTPSIRTRSRTCLGVKG